MAFFHVKNIALLFLLMSAILLSGQVQRVVSYAMSMSSEEKGSLERPEEDGDIHVRLLDEVLHTDDYGRGPKEGAGKPSHGEIPHELKPPHHHT